VGIQIQIGQVLLMTENPLLDMSSALARCSHMDQQETACNRPFIDRSRVSRSIERCMRGSLAQEDVIRYADAAERAYTLVL
jgi:hypothetical protein